MTFHSSPTRKPSTCIHCMDYRTEESELTVHFRVGTPVTHRGVPFSEFLAFRNCESPGSYYYNRIRRYPIAQPTEDPGRLLKLLCESCAIEEAKKRAKGLAL